MSRKKRKIRNAKVVSLHDYDFETPENYDKGTPAKKVFHLKDLAQVYPKTRNQKRVFQSWNEYDNLLLSGSAGTGKTYLALYMALREVLNPETPYEKVVIVRSTLPVRDQGFLPGTEEDKSAVYEAPYISICDELFEFKKSYANLKKNGYLEFISTSYIRGITLNNAIIIADESQNFNNEEISSVITRCGLNSRFIFCGDSKQCDAKTNTDKSSFGRLQRVIAHISSFAHVEFNHDDIVRSTLVREWIIASDKYS